MEGLHLLSRTDLLALTLRREGETKLGEKMRTIGSLEELQQCPAHFVVLGIPENIGVLANRGIAGTATAWPAVLRTMCNVQSNAFMSGGNILMLGHFEFAMPEEDSPEALMERVAAIDDQVYPVIQQIVAAGKVPIVVGGGHNNAYPIIKGLFLARAKAVDVVNIDAHADLRATNGRHSGNAFSYALQDGYLKGYGVFGLHENYNNAAVLSMIEKSDHISCIYFDEIIKTKDRTTIWADFIRAFDYNMGLEIDLDAIENVLSSAGGPSGFTLNDMRRLLLNSKKKLSYLHLPEGAVALSDGRSDINTAKTIVYLITDFIKAQSNL